jgi:hypothetical protein
MSKSVAALATLIIRFTTLWFGVIVGLIAFAFATRRIAAASAAGGPPGAAIPAGADPLPTMAASAGEGDGRSEGGHNQEEVLQ